MSDELPDSPHTASEPVPPPAPAVSAEPTPALPPEPPAPAAEPLPEPPVVAEPLPEPPVSTPQGAMVAAEGRRRVSGLVVLLAVLAMLAMVMAAVEWRRAEVLANSRDQRRAVERAASAFGQALLTYDFNDLAAARSRVTSLATDRFSQEYSGALAGGLDTAITRLKAVSNATVKDVYVAEPTDDTAHAVVTLDSEVKSTAGTRQTVSSYLELSLLRQGGQWKVDVVTSIGALDRRNTATTTTVPAPSSTTSGPPATSGTGAN